MKIRFVVPERFRGIFILVVNPEAEETPVVDGSPVYRIPKEGVLQVRNAAPFLDWYSKEASYDNGEPLPAGFGGPVEPYDDKELKLYTVSADSMGRFYFLVGTEEDLAEVIKTHARLPGSVLPPGL
jgi:hypothetical protein